MSSSIFNGKMIESMCEWTFPIEAVLGVTGNTLTLIVLLNKKMRNRTNIMLALVAMCDMLYLISMCPNQISRWPSVVYVNCQDDKGKPRKCFSSFAHFFLDNKTHFTFLVNWFSAASTWLIVVVSSDRLWAIKSPFRARSNLGYTKKDYIIIPSIFIITGGVSFHMNFSFGISQNSAGASKIVFVQTLSVVQILTVLNLIMQILIPMLLLIVLNAFLIYYLRNRRIFLTPKRRKSLQNISFPVLPPVSFIKNQNGDIQKLETRRGWHQHLEKTERHVTVTVTAIVTCYIISHIPSAFLYAYMYLFHLDTFYGEGWMYTMVAVSTTAVTCSKVTNFILFCLSNCF